MTTVSFVRNMLKESPAERPLGLQARPAACRQADRDTMRDTAMRLFVVERS
jgi:hypothetical protein